MTDLELCERENTNLRRQLLWAAQQLPPDKVRELRERLSPSIDDGGVVPDLGEETEDELLRITRRIDEMSTAVDAIVDLPIKALSHGAEVIAKLDGARDNLMGVRPDRDKQPMTLSFVRNTK